MSRDWYGTQIPFVQMLQSRGWLTGLTGDGVIDTPTLKKANVDIAAGLTGDGVNDAPNAGTVVEGATGHRVPGGFVTKFR